MALILSRPPFQRAVRPLLIDPRLFSVARLRRRALQAGCEFLVESWTTTSRLPAGTDRPPLDDYIVMTAARDGLRAPLELIEQVRPRASQVLGAIVLYADRRDQFPVLFWNGGHVEPPREVQFVGSRPFRLGEAAPEAGPLLFDPRALLDRAERESRTRGALRSQYDVLQSQRVLLCGAGRGGSLLASTWVAAGARRLTIADLDRIGHENLDAMPLAAPGDVGSPKSDVLARALVRNQPELAVSSVSASLASATAARVLREQRFDLVMTFVDSHVPRLYAGLSCQESLTAHLDVGTSVAWDADGRRVMSSDIRLFEPRRGCVACVPNLPEPDLAEALYELSAPEGGLRRGRPVAWNELRAGSLLHLNAVACALALETWLAYLEGTITTSIWRRLVWNAGGDPRIESALVDANASCPFCRR